MNRRLLRMLAATATLTATVLATTAIVRPTAALAEGTDPPWATCTAQTLPVTISPTDPTIYHVVGRLCRTVDAKRGAKTVELMISGLTYDHNYWNPAYQPTTYSMVYAQTSAGYSTFNIDRLGTGLADHPPAAQLTAQNEAWEIEQIIQALRAGTVGGVAFQTVVGVGHSLGAGVLQYEAATVTGAGNTPDYLVLSDFLTDLNPAGVAAINATMYDATQDPAFAAAGLPAGYITTEPNTRAADFYYTANADSAMIAEDEATKSTGSLAEFSVFSLGRTSDITHAIHVPTLLAVGEHDLLHCDPATPGLSCANAAAISEREAGNFDPTACLATYVAAGAGHDIDLHFGAGIFFNRVANWLNAYTVNNLQRDANGCLPTA